MAKVCLSCQNKCSECNRVKFPAPPVNTTMWNGSDWRNYVLIHGVDAEPETIVNSFGTWEKTGKRDEKGEALYSLKS